MKDRPIVIFDGHCNFCSGILDFIWKRDRKGVFLFTANQHEAGQRLLKEHGRDPKDVGTLYLVEGGGIHERSTAALRIARRLRFPWNLAYALIIVPAPLRDVAYKFVAANRYRIGGRKETCRIPTPEERGRFLQ